MDNWYDRVKSLMRQKRVTQDSLRPILGVKTRGAVGHYLTGRREPSIEQLQELAAYLGVTVGWMLNGDVSPGKPVDSVSYDQIRDPIRRGPRATLEGSNRGPGKKAVTLARAASPGHELEFIGHMDAWDSNTPLDDDEVELPLFREVELAAGTGQTQVIENHGAKLRFARSTLSRASVMPENAACAFVRGNSMEPVMPDGTTVGVNTGDKAIRDGEIYAIDHDGMLRVKYLHRRPGGGLKIVSQNLAEHPTEEYTAEEVAASIRIIGRVFWWSVLR